LTTRKFKVTVNGRNYDVEVEEIGGSTRTRVKKRAGVQARGSSYSAAQSSVSINGTVSAPIPGKVLSVEINVGETVKKGDTLLVIESMKIENPIFAPMDGRVDKVHVSVGSQVRTGDLLVTIS